MSVVRRADHHRVNLVAHHVEHPAEILELFRFRKLLEHGAGPAIIHVAQRHDVFVSHLRKADAGPSAGADAGDIDPAARWSLTVPAQHNSGNDLETEGCCSHRLEESSSFHS